MHRLRSLVPSANYLLVFEAAARRLSYTAAAGELNVTQPAVSKTIRKLEESLGFRLFRRERGALELTPEGRHLFQETQDAFDHLHLVIASLRRRNAKDVVRVSFSSAFVQFRLIPRLDAFKAAYPDIALRIEESSRDDQNLETENIDVSARLGGGRWADLRSWHFADEDVLPVCSPAYVGKHGPLSSVDQLCGRTLLHFEEKHRTRMTWSEWLRRCGVQRPRLTEGLVFTDNLGSVQAAVRGQGIALGWRHLVSDHIRSGVLVPALDISLRSGNAVYLVMPSKRRAKPSAELFRDWLLEHVREPGMS